jgi:hypothetical protein
MFATHVQDGPARLIVGQKSFEAPLSEKPSQRHLEFFRMHV